MKKLLFLFFVSTDFLIGSHAQSNIIEAQPRQTSNDSLVAAFAGCSACCSTAAECCVYCATQPGCLVIGEQLVRSGISLSGYDSHKDYCAHDWLAPHGPHIQFMRAAGVCTGCASVGLIYACALVFCGKSKRTQ